jgi:hypothetical protein
MQDLRRGMIFICCGDRKVNDELPQNRRNNACPGQLIPCSSSAGANDSATLRATSTAAFVNRRKIVEEITDERFYFLE